MSVTEIKTKAEFDALVASTPYVALQAHAQWCGPCKAISPFFAKAATAQAVDGKLAFARFDTDDVPDLAFELGIRSIPAFFFFENGDKTSDILGAKPPVLKQAIDGLAAKANGAGDAAAAEEKPAAEEKKDEAVSAAS